VNSSIAHLYGYSLAIAALLAITKVKAGSPVSDSLSCDAPDCARLALQVGSHGLQGYGAALPR